MKLLINCIILLIVVTVYSILILHRPTSHPRRDILHQTISRRIPPNTYQYYRFCLPRRCTQIQVDLHTCRDPIRCPDSYTWLMMYISNTDMYPTREGRSWTQMSVSDSFLRLNPSNYRYNSGHYYVGVHWECDPSCVNSTECVPCRNYSEYTIHARIERNFEDRECRALMCYRSDVVLDNPCFSAGKANYLPSFQTLVFVAMLHSAYYFIYLKV